ncbi:MAG: hypothetical protein ACFBSF_08710 [Leptolyngbyaceae cyanobacterium]
MKRFAVVFLVPAIALLAGCRFRTFTDAEGNKATMTRDGDAAEITIEGADGSEAQIAFSGSGVSLPEALPEDVPIFADATVMGTTVDAETLMVAMQTATQPEAVIEFYEEQLPANDWEITDTTRIPQGAFFTASKREERNVHVSVGGVNEGGTFITITIDMPGN